MKGVAAAAAGASSSAAVAPSTVALAAGAIFLAALLASGGGSGGGALYVPVFTLIYGSLEAGIPLSKATIFGVAISTLLINVRKRHPATGDRPLINFAAVAILEPATLLGAIFGVALNLYLRTWSILALLMLCLLTTTRITVAKAVECHFSEGGRSSGFIRALQWLLDATSARRWARRLRGTAGGEAPNGPACAGCRWAARKAAGSELSAASTAMEMSTTPLLAPAAPPAAAAAAATRPGGRYAKFVDLAEFPLAAASALPAHLAAFVASPASAATTAASPTSPAFYFPPPLGEAEIFADPLAGVAAAPPAGVPAGAPSSLPISRFDAISVSYVVLNAGVNWAGLYFSGGPGVLLCGSRRRREIGLLLLLILFHVACILGFAAGVTRHMRARGAAGVVERGTAGGGRAWLARVPAAAAEYTFFGVLAGTAAGALGIGGGLIKGPLLLSIGLVPASAVATSCFMILFTSSSTTLSFLLTGRLAVADWAVFGAAGFAGGLVGTLGVHHLMKRFRKQSLVSFFLALVIFASLLGMCASTLATASAHTEFAPLCATPVA